MSTGTVRAAALTNFFAIASDRGLDPLPLLREVGLTRSLLEDPDRRIPVEAAVRLLESAAKASGDQQFGLRMAQARDVGDMGVVSLIIGHQPTLREALRATIAYRHLINDSLALAMEEAGSVVIVREEMVSLAAARQTNELVVAVLHSLCTAVLGEDWKAKSVNFTHGAPRDLTLHRRMFGCPLVFDSEFNGIVCRASDLDAPNPAAAPSLARHAQRFIDSLPLAADEPSLVQEVRKAVYLTLASGHASSESVAQGLGMSVRTLQRRLDEGGTNFHALLNDVRRELAQRYLDNPKHPLLRISQMLGYRSPSAFTRWFATQFGQPPQRWRSERRSERAS